MVETTQNLNIIGFEEMMTPREIKLIHSISEEAYQTVVTSRKIIKRILERVDNRLLVVFGPCSIHDEKEALEFAEKVATIQEKVKSTMFLVMRTFFEKPRTTIGWKGLINDPDLDGSCNLEKGLTMARKILLKINEMSVPAATEMLEPLTPPYISDLISWSAIGARTTESQTHREMASGLSMPVGFKNSTTGCALQAINAMIAARSPQYFRGINDRGVLCKIHTKGNFDTHLILRGGVSKPNFDEDSIGMACELLEKHGLPQRVMVDCSHDNSGKQHYKQPMVWRKVIAERIKWERPVIGTMTEVNLFEGKQKLVNPRQLRYGVSITDACISWDRMAEMLQESHMIMSRAGIN